MTPLRALIIVPSVIVGVGAVLVALLWFGQRSLVFQPDTSQVDSAEQVSDGGRDLTLDTEDGLELGAWLLPPDDDADRETAVLYAPGNAANRHNRVGIAEEMTARGFTVLLMDYRGYGGNPGSPTEEGLAHDAAAAAEALEEEGFAPERTLYFGESIGSGVVARLQSTHPPAGMLMRSPFPDFVEVAREHYGFLPVGTLLRDRFPVTEHVEDSSVPVSVLHGDADRVVPSELSAEVAEDTGELYEEILLEGVDHNDPEMFGAPVAEALEDLADHAVE
ncbi:MAG: alpha/beta hydrolase [Nesterenkonia sp.]|nr:alpha/beta hydrolase [Nesterenkonia sp.]